MIKKPFYEYTGGMAHQTGAATHTMDNKEQILSPTLKTTAPKFNGNGEIHSKDRCACLILGTYSRHTLSGGVLGTM